MKISLLFGCDLNRKISRALSCLLFISFSALAQVSDGIIITSISATSPTPLNPVYVATRGLSPNSQVTVQFSNAAGFKVAAKPIRVANDGTMAIAVPLYFDPATVEIGSGVVSMVISQSNRSSAPVAMNIQNLPTLSTYGTNPGEISRAVLAFNAMLTARRLNQLQAFQGLPGNTVDSSQAQATLKVVLNAMLQAHTEVNRVANDNSLVVPATVLSDGSLVAFDAASLDLMDRVSAVFLSGTISELVPPSASTSAAFKPIKTGRARSAARREVSEIIKDLENIATVGGLTSAAAAAEVSDTSTNSTTTKIFDEAAALVGGEIGYLAAFKPLSQANNNLANRELGAVGALISDVHIVTNAWVDDLTYLGASLAGNQDLKDTVVNDLNQKSSDLWQALADVVVASPYVQGFEIVGPASSAVWSLASTYLNLKDAIKNVDAATWDTVSLSNFLGGPPNIASVISTTDWLGSTARIGLQAGVNLSSNGTVLNTVTDPNGSLEVQFPVQTPTFDGTNAILQIVEPSSGATLGSVEVNISDATVSGSLSVQAVRVNYPDRPLGYSPAYCEEVVKDYGELIAGHLKASQDIIADDLSLIANGADPDIVASWIAFEQRNLVVVINGDIFYERFFLENYGCWEQLSAVPAATPRWP